MNETQKIQIGARIASLRHLNNMTQEALAEKLNVSVNHISRVECGISSLSVKRLAKLRHVLDCSLDYILFGSCYDKALSRIPQELLCILRSENTEELTFLETYLQFYCTLSNKMHQ